MPEEGIKAVDDRASRADRPGGRGRFAAVSSSWKPPAPSPRRPRPRKRQSGGVEPSADRPARNRPSGIRGLVVMKRLHRDPAGSAKWLGIPTGSHRYAAQPPCGCTEGARTRRIMDRFEVDDEGHSAAQENFLDPRDGTHAGRRRGRRRGSPRHRIDARTVAQAPGGTTPRRPSRRSSPAVPPDPSRR